MNPSPRYLLILSWFSLLAAAVLVTDASAGDQASRRAAAGDGGQRTAPVSLLEATGWREANQRSDLQRRLAEQSEPLREGGAPTTQRRRLDGLAAPAALHAVAILVDFADSCFYGRQDLFDGLPTSTQSSIYYAAHDSLYYAHLLQDVADYFDAASGGRFSLEITVHGDVAALPEGMAHYGDHPEEGEQPFLLAADAIATLDDAIDFSAFDTVILIHAGAGQETDVLRNSPEQIYSTYLGPDSFRWAVEDSLLEVPFIPTEDFDDDPDDDLPPADGVRHVLILPENQFQDPYEGFSGQYGSLGTYCFVTGLRLGMLSLSDFTPAGAPDSQGVGQFCLMGYGLFAAGGYIPPQPCAFNKMLMGWLDPYPVDPDLAATWTLVPSAAADHAQAAARIDLTGAEYYLLEYRAQDPDGNGIFSFEGDRNANNVPDFFDTDSAVGGGIPTGFFDAEAGDVRERLVGAEWDFFLSDNTAREPGVKGAGSGLYVWHIDEGVIREVFGLRRNLLQSDPQRKAVDLVEADGIQDLDTREPSPFWLGGDDDSFRGEDNDTLGPETRPATTTNGGVRTGLWIDQISQVVIDSVHTFHAGTDSAYTGILYAEALTFRCRRESELPGAPAPVGARDLLGVDMTGSHLLVAPLDGDPANGEPVFVAAADSGRIYAWTADLAEWADHDDDPATFQPLAVGTDGDGLPVSWILPAAVGQFDPAAAGLEIVLASADGLYAFHQDGTPAAAGAAEADRGLVAALAVRQPPVLVPIEADGDPDGVVAACAVAAGDEESSEGDRLVFLDSGGEAVAPAVTLPGRATAPPVRLGHLLYVTVETIDGDGILVAASFGASTLVWQAALDIVPGDRPPLVASSQAGDRDPAVPGPLAILVTAADGRGQTVVDGPQGVQVLPPWSEDLRAGSPLGAGGAYLGEGLLGKVAAAGASATGWPRRPMPAIAAGAAQPLGLVSRAGESTFAGEEHHHLFATRDGRLYLLGPGGETVPGWPLAGPAELQATPAVLTLDRGEADERIFLMAAGTAPQIVGLDSEDASGPSLLTRSVTRLRSWEWPNEAPRLQLPPTGVMYGGSPWRGGAVGSMTDPASGARATLADSHTCYPQPLTGDRLRIRGQVPRQARARAVILNLQGQHVRDTGEVPVLGNAPFELEIDMRGVASGLYLCRLEADGQTSVRTIAVTR